MSGRLISPVVLPKLPVEQRANRLGTAAGRRPLPVPTLPSRQTGCIVYVMATVERRGRVIAHEAIGSLGWLPNAPLHLCERRGLVLITASELGTSAISKQGHLYLPTAIRRWCGLDAGARILVAADPMRKHLVIHPMAMLDAMFSQLHLELIGGSAS